MLLRSSSSATIIDVKKNILFGFTTLTVVFAVVGVMALVWWKNELKAPSVNPQTHSVLVTKGSSAETISKKLHEAGVIKNELVFKLYVRFTRTASSLPVGQFGVPGNLSVPEVIAFLFKGPTEVWVTVPEGLRREQVPERFVDALNLTGEQANSFKVEFSSLSVNDEGYLFPETYLVPKDTTAQKALAIMKNTFSKKAGAVTKENVILASLLERETSGDAEKSTVAGVLLNRIAIGMPLQVDATVQYAKANLTCAKTSLGCTDWWPTVYLDDYKLKNPFNTYQITGFPLMPIASPGLASLEAAANPTKSDYLYYIHDKNGVIHYAKTLAEHNANVQKYLR